MSRVTDTVQTVYMQSSCTNNSMSSVVHSVTETVQTVYTILHSNHYANNSRSSVVISDEPCIIYEGVHLVSYILISSKT